MSKATKKPSSSSASSHMHHHHIVFHRSGDHLRLVLCCPLLLAQPIVPSTVSTTPLLVNALPHLFRQTFRFTSHGSIEFVRQVQCSWTLQRGVWFASVLFISQILGRTDRRDQRQRNGQSNSFGASSLDQLITFFLNLQILCMESPATNHLIYSY